MLPKNVLPALPAYTRPLLPCPVFLPLLFALLWCFAPLNDPLLVPPPCVCPLGGSGGVPTEGFPPCELPFRELLEFYVAKLSAD